MLQKTESLEMVALEQLEVGSTTCLLFDRPRIGEIPLAPSAPVKLSVKHHLRSCAILQHAPLLKTPYAMAGGLALHAGCSHTAL